MMVLYETVIVCFRNQGSYKVFKKKEKNIYGFAIKSFGFWNS